MLDGFKGCIIFLIIALCFMYTPNLKTKSNTGILNPNKVVYMLNIYIAGQMNGWFK